MFEIAKAIHDISRTQSTWVFVLASAGVFALLGGIVGFVVDRQYKNALEERLEAATQLSLSCDTISLPMTYHGDLWILDTKFVKGFMKLSAPPTSEGTWPEPGATGTGFRCVLSNLGSAPTFGVEIPSEVLVRKIVHKENGAWNSGEVIEKHDVTLHIPWPLGQQGKDPFTFYTCSYDPDKFFEVKMPAHAYINGDNEGQKVKVPLRVAAMLGNPLPLMPTTRVSK